MKSSTNAGQMEGTIDLTAEFGGIPSTIYVAATAYATADGGALAAQGPAGNGDGNIEPGEFMPLSIAALKDENGDGKYDRLDPAIDFVIAQVTRVDGTTTILWNSVPGKTYQVETVTNLGDTWSVLGNAATAGVGQIQLSQIDATGITNRYYHVRLVNP